MCSTGNILVLDYGGGTLDISVLPVAKGDKFDASKVKYDGFSEGGSRMDQMLLDYALNKAGSALQKWYAQQNMLVRRRIKRNVENAKIKLSTDRETTIDFPGSGVEAVEVARADLALALQGITARMTVKVTEVELGAVGAIENIDFVVLSGGSSLTSAVQNTILSIFRHLPEKRFLLPDAGNRKMSRTASVPLQRDWHGSKGIASLQSILVISRRVTSGCRNRSPQVGGLHSLRDLFDGGTPGESYSRTTMKRQVETEWRMFLRPQAVAGFAK